MIKKVKRRRLNFFFPLEVYPYNIVVSIAETDEELKKSLKKLHIEWNEDMICPGSGRFIMKDKNVVIRIKSYPNNAFGISTVSHEAFHTTAHVLEDIGMSLVLSSNDEAFAYLLDFIVYKIYKKIKF